MYSHLSVSVFPNSIASLSNFHLRGSMLPNRFSRAWSNLPLSCDLGKDLGISQGRLEPGTAGLICCIGVASDT